VSARRSWRVLAKDLRLGPRSPLVLWALVLPVAMTLLVRGVFGSLFADEPRLGVVQAEPSAVTAAAQTASGIDVTVLDDAAALRADVEAGRLDAGIVLPTGFDEAVRADARPALELWISGASAAADRAVLTVAIIDAVRGLTPAEAPVEVEVVELGEAGLPIDLRLLPLLVIMAVAIAGGMVPAASLVEEKERGTLAALLSSPLSMGELLLAKGTLGFLLAVVTGLTTLLINDAFGAAPLATVLAILLGAVMMAEIGLLLGAWAPDTNTLFAAWKGGAILLIYPVVFFLWPELPGWAARLGPTYYFLRPVFALTVEQASLRDVAGDLAVAAVICAALVPAVAAAGRWLQRRLAIGKVERSAAAPPTPVAG
jgi:ABC-2 type transport system permease protein